MNTRIYVAVELVLLFPVTWFEPRSSHCQSSVAMVSLHHCNIKMSSCILSMAVIWLSVLKIFKLGWFWNISALTAVTEG